MQINAREYEQCELPPNFPTRLLEDSPAFYGLAGEVINRLAEDSEPGREQMLIQFLAAYGNMIGGSPYVIAAGARQAARINVLLIGPTADSRKGTSWQHVYNVLSEIDDDWAKNIQEGGLASGEGFIDLANEMHYVDPEAERLRATPAGELSPEEIEQLQQTASHLASGASPGLLVVEEEFARILRTMNRNTNILADTIKQTFGSGNLSNIRATSKKDKSRRVRARNVHASFICHITPADLDEYLKTTDIGNGFGGRFMPVAAYRRQLVPDEVDMSLSDDLKKGLLASVQSARIVGEVKFSAEARDLYRSVFKELSSPKPGPAGEMTSRGEAIVTRLSLIYALLDSSLSVEDVHLSAALAVWSYVQQSAKFIFRFREETGNRDLDLFMPYLREAEEEGLTGQERWAIVRNRNMTVERIEAAGWYGRRVKLLNIVKLKEGKGRPSEYWVLKEHYQAWKDLHDVE